jgi:hypothetical protein
MLEVATARPRFTISLKRSTQNLQLSTSSPADYPISKLVHQPLCFVLIFTPGSSGCGAGRMMSFASRIGLARRLDHNRRSGMIAS